MSLVLNDVQRRVERIEIVYRTPLGHTTSTWETESFDNFVRMYSNLVMNRLRIVTINFYYKENENGN